MKIFFTRYELLEKNNFPLWTDINAACVFIFIIGCFLLQIRDTEYKALSVLMITASLITFIISTYIFTAPAICRLRIVRRWFLLTTQYVICQALANTEYITGANSKGYLPHLTARKIIDYGYVSEERFDEVSTLAIVRNPYARMVSIYMYNRFGPWESFSHFVRCWYDQVFKDYRERGEMEEWYIPCHAIPQFEFTHEANGTIQLVHSVVKQEELKYLKEVYSTRSDAPSSAQVDRAKSRESDVTEQTSANEDENGSNDEDTDSLCSSSSLSSSEEYRIEGLSKADYASILSLPDTIRRALLEMPHENKRKTKTPWYDYYDQETLNLTFEMYHRDFEVLGYNADMEQRPDLEKPPEVVNDVPL